MCFSCGQPIGRVEPFGVVAAPAPFMSAPAAPHGASAPPHAPPAVTPAPQAMYPLTGALQEAKPVPPASPYAAHERAVLTGSSGEYVLRAGTELAVGRDPSQCGVVLTEPRVSGVHATLKLDHVQLWVRDETSNNGTFVDGARIPASEWTPVRSGAQLRFGPVEMTVRVE